MSYFYGWERWLRGQSQEVERTATRREVWTLTEELKIYAWFDLRLFVSIWKQTYKQKTLFCFKSYASFGYVLNSGLMVIFHFSQACTPLDEIHILNFGSLYPVDSMNLAVSNTVKYFSTHFFFRLPPPRFGFPYFFPWLTDTVFLGLSQTGTISYWTP